METDAASATTELLAGTDEAMTGAVVSRTTETVTVELWLPASSRAATPKLLVPSFRLTSELQVVSDKATDAIRLLLMYRYEPAALVPVSVVVVLLVGVVTPLTLGVAGAIVSTTRDNVAGWL